MAKNEPFLTRRDPEQALTTDVDISDKISSES
jgi:hypothetical protein